MVNKQKGGLPVTGEELLWNKSLLLSSPLRLSTYPLSHQSVKSLQHLSPTAFLRPVNHSHFTADRLMRQRELQAPHMPGQGGRWRYTIGGVMETDGRTDTGHVWGKNVDKVEIQYSCQVERAISGCFHFSP